MKGWNMQRSLSVSRSFFSVSRLHTLHMYIYLQHFVLEVPCAYVALSHGEGTGSKEGKGAHS